jgi:hypothetical protein
MASYQIIVRALDVVVMHVGPYQVKHRAEEAVKKLRGMDKYGIRTFEVSKVETLETAEARLKEDTRLVEHLKRQEAVQQRVAERKSPPGSLYFE